MHNKNIRPRSLTLCLDLEFTHGKKKVDKISIYEIGIAVIDENGLEVDNFSTYVRPSYFCFDTLDFLSLQESDFDNAPDVNAALLMMNEFVEKQNSKSDNIKWCSWGVKDKEILSRNAGLLTIQSGHKLLRIPYFDAQAKFQKVMPHIYARPSLQKIVENYCGMYIENHHSALADSRALGQIVNQYRL